MKRYEKLYLEIEENTQILIHHSIAFNENI